ncbi:MAG: phospholipase C, phosphocholine-specific [Bacteroidota bacterium]|nr:phospholipase C, phosphocholine-specific [Bacteroidota bacterium]
MDTRREFIKKASFLAGGAGIWGSLPASIKKAIAINPNPGTTFEDAEHVVFLMQENRSFDHCFGTLQGVRGFNDPRFISLPTGDPVWLQSNKAAQKFVPFHLNMKDTQATWMGGLPHSWDNQVDALNNGKHDGWLEAKRPDKEYEGMPLTMGYYKREDIPFYYALADAFTVCDQHFCASLTGTTCNRTFFWSGKNREKPGEQANVLNSDTYYNREAHWKTFPERLEENGIPWRVYQNEISLQTELAGENEDLLSNFTDNNLEWFSAYNVRFHKAHYDFLIKRIAELPAEIDELHEALKKAEKKDAEKIEKEWKLKKDQLVSFKEETITWSPENFEKLSDFEKNIHNKAFTTNVNDSDYHQSALFSYEDDGVERSLLLPKGDILHQFREDVDNGKLPTVSWLVAPQYFSDHPSAPWLGAWYVSEVLDILTKNPEVWKKTIFILNYDENDGYFDHIPPFTAPKPNDPHSGKVSEGIDTSDEYVTMEEELRRNNFDIEDVRENSIGLGFRVPLVIASPWTRGGWVNSQVCDITSTLQFLEKFLTKKTGKEIKETNISDWRRLVSGDLTSAFRPYNGEKIKLPEFVKRDPFVEKIYNAKFKKLPSDYEALSPAKAAGIKKDPLNSPLLPKQEAGTRDSCALPYQLEAEGQLSEDKKTFDIHLAAGNELFGAQSSGSPFYVYAPGKYAVYDVNNRKNGFENVKVWNYAVRAGDQLKNQWPLEDFENDQYHLRVYGPNGFFREFAGSKNDPEITITLGYEPVKGASTKLSGNVFLSLRNMNKNEAYILDIADLSYKKGVRTVVLRKGSSIVIESFNLSDSHNWYDLSVKVRGNNIFEKRYAGRVETGQNSRTDPAMGKV